MERFEMELPEFMKDNLRAENAFLKEKVREQEAYFKNEIYHRDCLIGRMEYELRATKVSEQKRQECWKNATIYPPAQDGLYWGRKDNTNSMWPVQYNSGVWTLSAYPETKMEITEWAYWDAFEKGESHDD